jgi:hypothetical protein
MLLFNCRLSELLFSYRAYAGARSSPAFRFSDPFVLEHPQYYRLLQEIHSEVHDGQRNSKAISRPPEMFGPAELCRYGFLCVNSV